MPPRFNREEIHNKVLNIIRGLMEDVDFGFSGEIGPESRVVADLDFESVKVVQLFTRIQKQFGNQRFPFQDLVFRGKEDVDFTIRDLVDFLHGHLSLA